MPGLCWSRGACGWLAGDLTGLDIWYGMVEECTRGDLANAGLNGEGDPMALFGFWTFSALFGFTAEERRDGCDLGDLDGVHVPACTNGITSAAHIFVCDIRAWAQFTTHGADSCRTVCMGALRNITSKAKRAMCV